MTTQIFYTGIGSRRTPHEVLGYMRRLAAALSNRSFTLRSGAADGADSAFEEGCDAVEGGKEIWLPWRNFNGHADTGLYPTEAHFLAAANVHPAWAGLSRGPRALHARNVGQVLGLDINTPSSFVVCWTPDGCESEATRTRDTGGTGTAIVLANRNAIPVFNLANPSAKIRLGTHVLGVLQALSGQTFQSTGATHAKQ